MLIYIIFVFDLLFVIFHLIFGQSHNFLNIGVENNLPTLFQSLKTLVVGILVLLLIVKSKEKIWPILAGIILIFFAFDDWFQIHEKIANSFYYLTPPEFNLERRYTWIILYLPILIVAFLVLYKLKDKIKRQPFIITGLLLLVLAFGFEVLESLKVCQSFSFYRTTLEEGLEMLGISSLLVAFIAKR